MHISANLSDRTDNISMRLSTDVGEMTETEVVKALNVIRDLRQSCSIPYPTNADSRNLGILTEQYGKYADWTPWKETFVENRTGKKRSVKPVFSTNWRNNPYNGLCNNIKMKSSALRKPFGK